MSRMRFKFMSFWRRIGNKKNVTDIWTQSSSRRIAASIGIISFAMSPFVNVVYASYNNPSIPPDTIHLLGDSFTAITITTVTTGAGIIGGAKVGGATAAALKAGAGTAIAGKASLPLICGLGLVGGCVAIVGCVVAYQLMYGGQDPKDPKEPNDPKQFWIKKENVPWATPEEYDFYDKVFQFEPKREPKREPLKLGHIRNGYHYIMIVPLRKGQYQIHRESTLLFDDDAPYKDTIKHNTRLWEKILYHISWYENEASLDIEYLEKNKSGLVKVMMKQDFRCSWNPLRIKTDSKLGGKIEALHRWKLLPSWNWPWPWGKSCKK